MAFRAVVATSTLLSLTDQLALRGRAGTPVGEYAAILMAATVGAMLLCGATDLVSIFVALETLSVSSYLAVGLHEARCPQLRKRPEISTGGFCCRSRLFVRHLAALRVSGGSTNLDAITSALQGSGVTPLSALALVFVLATVAFKISAVPFHQWTPDVYEGSPTPVVAFLSVGSKAAGFALALRLLVGCFESFQTQWQLLFTVLAVLSMTLGNVVALAQTSMSGCWPTAPSVRPAS